MSSADQAQCKSESQQMQHKEEQLEAVLENIRFFGSVLSLLAIVGLCFFLCKHRRKGWFQFKVILCLSIKRILILILSGTPIDGKPDAFIFVVEGSLGVYAQWIYASQYMKTCNILPYLVKNAQLLVQRHKAGTENWREVAGLNSTFMSMHESIDSAIKETKARIE